MIALMVSFLIFASTRTEAACGDVFSTHDPIHPEEFISSSMSEWVDILGSQTLEPPQFFFQKEVQVIENQAVDFSSFYVTTRPSDIQWPGDWRLATRWSLTGGKWTGVVRLRKAKPIEVLFGSLLGPVFAVRVTLNPVRGNSISEGEMLEFTDQVRNRFSSRLDGFRFRSKKSSDSQINFFMSEFNEEDVSGAELLDYKNRKYFLAKVRLKILVALREKQASLLDKGVRMSMKPIGGLSLNSPFFQSGSPTSRSLSQKLSMRKVIFLDKLRTEDMNRYVDAGFDWSPSKIDLAKPIGDGARVAIFFDRSFRSELSSVVNGLSSVFGFELESIVHNAYVGAKSGPRGVPLPRYGEESFLMIRRNSTGPTNGRDQFDVESLSSEISHKYRMEFFADPETLGFKMEGRVDENELQSITLIHSVVGIRRLD